MSFIIYLREKKGVVKGFLLFTIFIFLSLSIGSIYQMVTQEGEPILEVGNRKFYKNDYERFKESFRKRVERTSLQDKDPHESIIEEIILAEIAQDRGISVSDQKVRAEIENIGPICVEVFEKLFFEFSKGLSHEEKKAKIQQHFEQTNQKPEVFFAERSFFKHIKNKLLKERILTLFPSLKKKGTCYLKEESSRDISYVKIASSQIDEKDISLSESEKKECHRLPDFSPSSNSQEYTNVDVIPIVLTPSTQERDTAYEIAWDVKEKFEKAENPKNFLGPDGENPKKINRKADEVPPFIKKLKKGEVSKPTSSCLTPKEATNAVCLYRRDEDSGSEIVYYELKIKIKRKQSQSFTEQEAQQIQESWDDFIKKKKVEPKSFKVTKKIANQEKGSTLGRLASKIYREGLLKGETGTIENKETGEYWVFCVGEKGDYRIPTKESIEKKIVAKKKTKKIQQDFRNSKNATIEQVREILKPNYGVLRVNKEQGITIDSDLFTDKWSCSAVEIVKLLALEKGGIHVLWDQKSDSVIVAVVTEKNRKPLQPIIKEDLKPLEEIKKAFTVVDRRYLLQG